MNTLYYGDNLDILRRYIKDESVDLIYLDPPFKSDRDYNILFEEKNGTGAASQIKAFEDTWQWDQTAAAAYHEVVEAGGKVSEVMQAFRKVLGHSDMLAYLAMMAPRLVELRRVLKATGSLYLHCDTTASHYLKLLLDAVFGVHNFRNEIIWKRKTGRGETNHKSNKFGVCTDSIFFFAKSDQAELNAQFNMDAPGYQEYVDTFFRHVDEHGRKYALDNLASPSARPNLIYEYKGYKPPKKGWAISREKMEEWDKEGRLFFPTDKQGRIRRKRYLDELQGKPVQNLWDDIEMIGAQAVERLGYPTQKPVALLERIIQASSVEGDVVLDPFCGCGTTISAAQQLKREWIGIDVTCLAVTLMKHRIKETFGGNAHYVVVGEPVSLPDAEALAQQDRMQFQWWALGLVGARPVEQKKGADHGIDGRLYFHDTHALQKGATHQIVISVKSGHVSVKDVRDLRGVIEREHAAIGVLITLEDATKPMRQEIADAGFYHSDGWHQDFPRLQILTIQDLLDGRTIEYPYQQYSNVSLRKPKQAKDSEAVYGELPLHEHPVDR